MLSQVRASALSTLKKLLTCRLPQLLLYRELVTLRDDLPIVFVNNDSDVDLDDKKHNVHDNRNGGNDRNDHSEHFRYEGERAGAEAHLQGMRHPLIRYNTSVTFAGKITMTIRINFYCFSSLTNILTLRNI